MRVALISLVVTVLLSATTMPQVWGDGQPETLEGALQRHHVALTKKALVSALRSPDEEVRRLAAQELAQDGASDAIPSIREALKAETLPLNQVNIAFSLAQLGDGTGLATLRGTCENPAAPGGIRMLAAQYMQNLHKQDCRKAVVQVLKFGDDSGSRIQALSLALDFPDESLEMFDLVVKALTDQDPGVRMTASSMLGRLGNVSAIPYLEEALAKEQNDGCVLEMRMDLQHLRKQEARQR